MLLHLILCTVHVLKPPTAILKFDFFNLGKSRAAHIAKKTSHKLVHNRYNNRPPRARKPSPSPSQLHATSCPTPLKHSPRSIITPYVHRAEIQRKAERHVGARLSPWCSLRSPTLATLYWSHLLMPRLGL